MMNPGQRIQARSRVIQVCADNLLDAQDKMQTASQGNNQCIMAMVRRNMSCCCCDLKFDVPANYTVLEEDCGSKLPLMRPGAHWCYPCNKRVICLLTKNIINYDAPVQRCPTKDNAYVDIDIHFTFRLP